MRSKSLQRQILFLAFGSLIAFAFSLLRMHITGTRMFLFLNWNLFLALIPFGISVLMLRFKPKNWLTLLVLLGTWLLFLPNAPYILTDIFHIKHNQTGFVWYDMMLIFTFAFVGVFSMLWSIQHLHHYLRNFIHKKIVPWLITFTLFVTSFGVYLGRFLRWNSWDIIEQPMNLGLDIAHRFIHPFQHPRTWAITIMLGLILNMIYWSYTLFSDQNLYREI